MKIKNGDIVEFLAISWDNPVWDYDFPCCTLKPVKMYSSVGSDAGSFIEDLAISLECGFEIEDDKDFEDDCECCGTSSAILKRVCNNRLKGKNDWETKVREVIRQKIKFITNEYGDFTSEILETQRA